MLYNTFMFNKEKNMNDDDIEFDWLDIQLESDRLTESPKEDTIQEL